MNSVKRTHAAFIITVIFLLVTVPILFPTETAFAQTTGYTITQVDHSIEVMYSGQVAIKETIHISGQVTDGFTIGLPAKYSANILKAVAYDDNNIYQVNLGVQLGDHSGFYAAEINFNGHSPSIFTVAFLLSNDIISYVQDSDYYTLSFPAYPSLTQNTGTCNVTVTLPSTPSAITITKDDGNIDGDHYITQNVPAYTYSVATAAITIQNGTLELTTLSQLNRQIDIDPTGKVSVSDVYHMTNNSPITLTSFVFDLPTDATNIIIKDEFGRELTTNSGNIVRDILLANATLVTFLATGQSGIITINYNVPSAAVEGSKYVLSDFKLYPDIYYYVNSATFTFNPPEGASIVTPQLSSLDSSSSLTRASFQDTLTITRDGISYIDYGLSGGNNIQLAYNYNPVWVSFLPTVWVSFLAVIGCIGAVFFKRRRPSEKEPSATKTERQSTVKETEAAPTQQTKATTQAATSQRVTTENLKEFTDAYEEKKQLNTELKSLDAKAQKGKIPRRQYKVQRRAIEIRLENLARNNSRIKEALRRSSAANAELMNQLDDAEADLNEAEENIRNLELRQSRGEIPLETYKKNIGDYQKRRDKAESSLNGILLRLREKAR